MLMLLNFLIKMMNHDIQACLWGVPSVCVKLHSAHLKNVVWALYSVSSEESYILITN